jgi:hypothetical protein
LAAAALLEVGAFVISLAPPWGEEGLTLSGAQQGIAAAQRAAQRAGALATLRGGIGPVQRGQLGVQLTSAYYKGLGWTEVGREISIEVNGVRWRADLLMMNTKGQLVAIESKFGPSAGFTKNQSITIPAIQNGATGVLVGGNARGLNLAGTPISSVEVKTWP